MRIKGSPPPPVCFDPNTLLCIFEFLICIFNFRAVFNLAGSKMRGRPCNYHMWKDFLQQWPFSRALQLLKLASDGGKGAQSSAVSASSLPD